MLEMSKTGLKDFLKALEDVKDDLTCPICTDYFNNPITFRKCFHSICSKHYTSSLEFCPECNVNLENCEVFVDPTIEDSAKITKELHDMFKHFESGEERNKPIQPKTRPNSTEKSKPNTSTNISESKPSKINAQSKSILQETRTVGARTSRENSSATKLNRTVEKRNLKGETALHIACRTGKIEKAIELIKQGANVNTKDNAGWTPLHEAVQNGRLDIVKLLIENNVLINVPGMNNETPLHEAVRFNHNNIVEELVENGADVHIRNSKGETPLHLASEATLSVLQRAMESLKQSQGANITLISEKQLILDLDDMYVFCSTESKTIHKKLRMLAKCHPQINLEQKFSNKVTHLIVDAEDGICESNVVTLQAIVNGLWILTTEWVQKSTECNLEMFEKYEVAGVSTPTSIGPRTSRFNKYKQLPGLFDGCHLYLHNFNTKEDKYKPFSFTKATLSKLIADAGGIVLRRVPNPESIPNSEKLVPYHAKQGGDLEKCSHYIIFNDTYEPRYDMAHLKALPVGWLIECIEKYELCEPW